MMIRSSNHRFNEHVKNDVVLWKQHSSVSDHKKFMILSSTISILKANSPKQLNRLYIFKEQILGIHLHSLVDKAHIDS